MKAAFSTLAPLTIAMLAALAAGCSDHAPVAPASSDDRTGFARIISIRERPIEEFVFAQGGLAGSGMGASLGVAGGITWIDRALDVSVAVDYAGVIHRREERWSTPPADASEEPVADDVVDVSIDEPKESVEIAPPKFSGRVIEQILSDGSARVIVDLTTSGALAFASYGTSASFEKVFFGATAYADQRAVRGDSRLRLVYRTAVPGSALPQISRLIYAPAPGEAIEQLVFTAIAASSLPPALQDPKSMTLDYRAFGGLGGSLGAIGTISGAVVGFQ